MTTLTRQDLNFGQGKEIKTRKTCSNNIILAAVAKQRQTLICVGFGVNVIFAVSHNKSEASHRIT